jgi:LPXTG-motif cell wall-anchored protein
VTRLGDQTPTTFFSAATGDPSSSVTLAAGSTTGTLPRTGNSSTLVFVGIALSLIGAGLALAFKRRPATG